MEDSFKSIKVFLDYYDEDGLLSKKEMTIKVNKVKDISISLITSKRLKYSISFSLTLPNHIHSYIVGKTIPQHTLLSQNKPTEYPIDFSKTINKYTLEQVCDSYWDILQDYKWLKNIEKACLQKVIFYNLQNNTQQYRSERNSLVFGTKNTIGFKYCIGYISELKNNKILRYNSEKLLVNESNDRLFYADKYVLFTEERQLFFDGIQNTFESIMSKINDFENNISEENINELISGGLKLIS